MESELLSDDQIEWEAKRVAAAFGVKKFTRKSSGDSLFHYQGRVGRTTVRWVLGRAYGPVRAIQVGKGQAQCGFFRLMYSGWQCHSVPAFSEQMARALYLLNFEDESVLSQFPQLTADEKLELRLSLPHEFWPTTWMDEASSK